MPSKYMIRDLVCLVPGCGTESFDQMVLSCQYPILHPCANCKRDTKHGDQGTNSSGGVRYRFQDLPTESGAYRGQIKTKNLSCTFVDEDGVERDELSANTGKKITDGEHFSVESTEERQKKIYHKIDAKKGKTALHIDQKKKG